MQAENDEERLERADQRAGDERREVVDGLVALREPTAHDGAEGAEDGQGERDDNDDRDRRREQAAEGLGDDLVAGLLDPARAVDGKKDGDDGAGVRRLRELEAKQLDGRVRRHDGGDGRIHQDAAEKDGGHRVNIEAL